jgi:hypothetical protein
VAEILKKDGVEKMIFLLQQGSLLRPETEQLLEITLLHLALQLMTRISRLAVHHKPLSSTLADATQKNASHLKMSETMIQNVENVESVVGVAPKQEKAPLQIPVLTALCHLMILHILFEESRV